MSGDLGHSVLGPIQQRIQPRKRRRLLAAIKDLHTDLQHPPILRPPNHLLTPQQQPPLVTLHRLDPHRQPPLQPQFRHPTLRRNHRNRAIPQNPAALRHQPRHAHGGGHGDGDDRQRDEYFNQGESCLGGFVGHRDISTARTSHFNHRS